MPAVQLRETTMNPMTRTLIRVMTEEAEGVTRTVTASNGKEISETDDLVDRLMGRNAEARFRFIQDRAAFVQDVDI